MKHYLFELNDTSTLKKAKKELEQLGLHDIYTVQEENKTRIGGFFDGDLSAASIKETKLIEDKEASIEWQEQWENFAPNFSDGVAHIDLSVYKASVEPLLLKPGGGFGDLSHPTTRLMLRALAKRAPQKNVIDIGCGSGILSLAAALMGAKTCLGIDIDEAAVAHALQNQRLNHLENKVHFSTSIDDEKFLNEPLLILMNMITSEQKIAWESQKKIHTRTFEIITSGVLKSQKKQYLQQAKIWNWQLLEQEEEDNWLCFVFKNYR